MDGGAPPSALPSIHRLSARARAIQARALDSKPESTLGEATRTPEGAQQSSAQGAQAMPPRGPKAQESWQAQQAATPMHPESPGQYQQSNYKPNTFARDRGGNSSHDRQGAQRGNGQAASPQRRPTPPSPIPLRTSAPLIQQSQVQFQSQAPPPPRRQQQQYRGAEEGASRRPVPEARWAPGAGQATELQHKGGGHEAGLSERPASGLAEHVQTVGHGGDRSLFCPTEEDLRVCFHPVLLMS